MGCLNPLARRKHEHARRRDSSARSSGRTCVLARPVDTGLLVASITANGATVSHEAHLLDTEEQIHLAHVLQEALDARKGTISEMSSYYKAIRLIVDH